MIFKDCIEDLESGKRNKGGAINEGIPSLGAEHLDGTGKFYLQRSKMKYISNEFFMSMKKGKIKKGDIILVKDGATTGKVSFVEDTFPFEEAAINEHLFLVRSKECYYNKYIFYLLLSEFGQNQIRNDFRGATVGGISKEFVNFNVNIPEVDKQVEIANKLDKVREIIDIRKKQIDELSILIKSQFVEMFGDPVFNNLNWNKLKMSELGIIERGTSKHRPRNASELLGGLYPLIQTGDISNSDLYITEYKSTYSELGLKQSKMWNKDTLCITIAANIAQTSILTFNACFPDSVVGFITNGKVNNIFMHYWFDFLQKIIDAQATQVAQKNINLKILNNLDVIVPPIELQNQFADIVQKINKQKFKLEESLKETEKLMESLMNQYFN